VDSPVTQVALVAVKNASIREIVLPSAEEIGSANSRVPKNMIPENERITI